MKDKNYNSAGVNQNNRIWKLIGANMFFVALILIIFFVGVPSGKIFQTFTGNIYSTYSVVALASLILIDILFIIEVLIKKKDEKYGDGLLFVSQGELPAVGIMKNVPNSKLWFGSIALMSLLSTIIFITMGDLGKFANSTSSIIDVLLIMLENVMLASIIAIDVFLTRAFARKFNWSKATFMALSWISVIGLGCLFGWFMHLYSKAGNSFGLTYSLIFWGFMGIIHLLTGSIFASTGFHFVIDLPFFINVILSNSWVITVFVIITIVSLFLTFKIKGKNIAFKDVKNGSNYSSKNFNKNSQKVYEDIFTE